MLAEDSFTLATIYEQWQGYQERLRNAIAPLTDEQLAIRAAPHLRSVGENAAHIIGCRAGWLTDFLHEDCGADVAEMTDWDESGAAAPSAGALARGLNRTWECMAACLDRWTPEQMRETFPDDWDGKVVHLSRAWVVYHVLEHDLSHGGEISLTLGMHNLQGDFTT